MKSDKEFAEIADLVKKVQEQKRRQALAMQAAERARRAIQKKKQFVTKHTTANNLAHF
ncbi:MAG: hypothetical protein ACE5KM_24695 [Planctomycetaceae bacterium]